MTLEEQRALTVSRLQAYANTLQDRPAAAAWVLIGNLAGALVDSLHEQATLTHEQAEVIKGVGLLLADQAMQLDALQHDLYASVRRIKELERVVSVGTPEGGNP